MFSEGGNGPKGEALFVLTTFPDGTTLCRLSEVPAQRQAQAWQTQILDAVAQALALPNSKP